jgi:hypothetical protein
VNVEGSSPFSRSKYTQGALWRLASFAGFVCRACS